ncbi:hypothetical protein A7K50_03025 [Dehalobacter sp. MCB1]|uniref:hypothetical protein n=1 Tax=Dehalobacter sp. MCB1 TaxID=1844756 RepID=UPI000E6D3E6F|nr:hypothetical protein [Dehalobacter sp. MCB1]RJE47638.1 hypothetical protein A7K50_03025 [Dehalobacter sp. MCB1]
MRKMSAVFYHRSQIYQNTAPAKSLTGEKIIEAAVPFYISLLISNALHPSNNSPVGTLIIPLTKIMIPHGYFIIVGLELATALFYKWSVVPVSSRIFFPGEYGQALPDISALREDRMAQLKMTQTPLIPKEGMTINISLSAPFTPVQSRASTLYAFKLKSIDNVPGYVVPLASLILYGLLAIFGRTDTANTSNGSSS